MIPKEGKVYSVFDGPRDKPNGRLLVRVETPDVYFESEVERFYICTVLESRTMNGKTCAPGTKIRIHQTSFEKGTQ